MKIRKLFACLLFYCVFSISLFSEAVSFFTSSKPDLSASYTLAHSLRNDLRTEPFMFENTFRADFKELRIDCGFSVQNSKIDFTSGIDYLPKFFGFFRGGFGFRHHVYRYVGKFTENDLFLSACLEWCKTDFFTAELAGGAAFKFAAIDALQEVKPVIFNCCPFLEVKANFLITPELNAYASFASYDYFDYPLFATPYFKTGLGYRFDKSCAIDCSVTLKFVDMITSAVYLNDCIIRTALKVYF